MRTQFHHIMDVMPTILEAAGIRAPEMLNGIPQKPIEGVSMVYTFETMPRLRIAVSPPDI